MLKTTGKLFLLLFLSLAIIAVYPGTLFLLAGGKWPPSSEEMKTSGTVFGVVLCSITFGIGIVLLIAFLKRLFPSKDAPYVVERRLIALAIVALLFPTLVTSILSTVLTAFTNLFSGLAPLFDPTTTSTSAAQSTSSADKTVLSQATPSFLTPIQVVGSQLTRFLAAVVRPLLGAEVCVAYAIWLLIYFLFGQGLQETATPQKPRWTRIKEWFSALTAAARYHTLLACLFLFGCYLSIAAIVAIPTLQHQAPDTTSKAQLQAALREMVPEDAQFETLFPEAYKSQDPLSGAADILTNYPNTLVVGTSQTNASETYQRLWKLKLDQARNAIQNAQNLRHDYIIRWQRFRSDVREAEKALVKQAVSAFEIDTLVPMATEERNQQFQSLVDWVRQSTEDLHSSLRNTRRFLDGFDSSMASGLQSLRNELDNDLDFLRNVADNPGAYVKSWSSRSYTFTLERLRYDAISAEGSRAFDQPYVSGPTTPEPASYSGPFGLIAKWLLRTRSFSLALITGMIGFGLLGASIASLIRKDVPDAENRGPAGNAGKIAVQGLSAAVVIFLAVQGGLAIFTSGEKEPNGYVVCFACLVGAVFSEHVWLWARQRLVNMLDTKRDEDEEEEQQKKKAAAAVKDEAERQKTEAETHDHAEQSATQHKTTT